MSEPTASGRAITERLADLREAAAAARSGALSPEAAALRSSPPMT